MQDSTAASQAVGGYVFYNRSALDGNNTAADAADDAAIAADKQALLLPPGDGKIDAADLMIVRNNQRHTLYRFAPPPPPTEGTAAAAPAASPSPYPPRPLAHRAAERSMNSWWMHATDRRPPAPQG